MRQSWADNIESGDWTNNGGGCTARRKRGAAIYQALFIAFATAPFVALSPQFGLRGALARSRVAQTHQIPASASLPARSPAALKHRTTHAVCCARRSDRLCQQRVGGLRNVLTALTLPLVTTHCFRLWFSRSLAATKPFITRACFATMKSRRARAEEG